MSREQAISALTARIFDLLDGPFANLCFDSTCVSRPLRLDLPTGPVAQVVVRWPVGTALALTDLRLCTTAANSRGKRPKSIRIDTDSPTFTCTLKGAEVTQTTDVPQDGMHMARLCWPEQTATTLILERAQNHQPLPEDFTVHLAQEGSVQTCLFDHAAEKSDFTAAIGDLPEARKYTRSVRIITREVMAVIMGNYADTRASFKKVIARTGHDTFKAFTAITDASWLDERDHEYAQHGVSNTFRYWSRETVETFLSDISALIEQLETHDIPAIACFGTLLGPVRDGGLIPHDDDADILCFNTDESVGRMTFLSKLAGIAALHGFSVRKISLRGKFVQLLTPSGRQVDFFACDVRGDECHVKPARHGPTKTASIFPIKTGKIMGMPMPFPNDEKALLHDIYGEGWTVPQPYFLHEWR